MPSSLNFEFQFRAVKPQDEGDDALPMRVLVLGDFSGRANQDQENPRTVGQRPTVAVDIDNLDQVMGRLGACLRLQPGQAERTDQFIDIKIEQLDDFHPDSLYQNLPLFRALRDTRARLQNPGTFAAAAIELGFGPARTQTRGGDEAPLSAFESLLGGKVNRPAEAASPVGGGRLDALIKSVVAPYIVAGPDPIQGQCLAAVDAAIGDQMRAILHHPQFQALEAAWRAIHFLITSLELDQDLQLHLVDISKNELLADVNAAEGNLENTGIHHLLVEKWQQSPDGAPWSVLLGNYSFDGGGADVALLASLGALARQAGAPFLAQADSRIVGCANLAGTPDPRDWRAPDAASATLWKALRNSAQAQWIGLATPRLLLRLPYGKNSDQVEQFDFEETIGLPAHENYLWGNPALACVLVLGRAFSENGWDMTLGGGHEIGDLPAHTYKHEGEAHMQPCAEINLSQRGGEALQQAGLMPLHSHKNRNAVQLPFLSSLASPSKALSGPWMDD